jgi:5-methylcytosine-specific restriction endonuclease McrA
MAAGICKRCGDPTGTTDGRRYYCEGCRVARVREANREGAARRLIRKPCIRCGGDKGLGERRRLCDACIPLAVQAQRERVRHNSLKRYYANRAQILADERERRKRDPEFAERKNHRAREWRKANPDQARENDRRHLANYRAQLANVYVEDVEPLVVLERDDNRCGICGGDVDPFNFHVDHVIPVSLGGEHSYANVQAAHPLCNQKKWAYMPEEVMPDASSA